MEVRQTSSDGPLGVGLRSSIPWLCLCAVLSELVLGMFRLFVVRISYVEELA